jgi:hypothetical protein
MKSDSVELAVRVIAVLEDLGISYQVGGSFASSIHGIPRLTQDLDLVIDLAPDQVPLFASRFQEDFYLDIEAIQSAIARRRSFNLIHLSSGFKIDLFPRGTTAFDRSELARCGLQRLVDEPPRDVVVTSPEDTILRKLEWYRLGGEVSDRQWNDILGVIQTQGPRLDLAYLRQWAREIGVDDLLARALGL